MKPDKNRAEARKKNTGAEKSMLDQKRLFQSHAELRIEEIER